MSRGFYTRHAKDAAVTKLIAKPMLHTFFPGLSHIEQPLRLKYVLEEKFGKTFWLWYRHLVSD
jgi:hypothetical protein